MEITMTMKTTFTTFEMGDALLFARARAGFEITQVARRTSIKDRRLRELEMGKRILSAREFCEILALYQITMPNFISLVGTCRARRATVGEQLELFLAPLVSQGDFPRVMAGLSTNPIAKLELFLSKCRNPNYLFNAIVDWKERQHL